MIDLSQAPGSGEAWDAPAWKVYAWGVVELLVVSNPWQISSRLRRRALTAFGARIGEGVLLRPRLRVRFPWKLTIGSDAEISQGTFITTGSHAHRRDMGLITRPVLVEDGAWITARCVVLGGSRVGVSAVVTPGTVVSGEVPDGMVFGQSFGTVLHPRFR